jgi:hypothetical protein
MAAVGRLVYDPKADIRDNDHEGRPGFGIDRSEHLPTVSEDHF